MSFKIVFTSLLLILLVSCKKANINNINNLNGNLIYVVGHGGIGFQSVYNQLPENSMLSINKAVDVYGADGVEVDVQLSKDLKLVLYHDDRLETSTDGYGFVYEYDVSELRQFKYSRDMYVNLFIDEHIGTLEEVLQKFYKLQNKPQLHLDLRSWLYDASLYNSVDFFDVYTSKIINILSEYQYEQYTYITSGDINLLKEFSDKSTHLKLMIETSQVNWAVEKIKEYNWYGFVAYNHKVSKQDIDYAHSKGVRVALFGVKSQSSQVDAVNKHPDFIITDNIPQLQQILYN